MCAFFAGYILVEYECDDLLYVHIYIYLYLCIYTHIHVYTCCMQVFKAFSIEAR